MPNAPAQAVGVQQKPTAQAVIEMFADLGLAVCDETNAIKAKVDEQRNRRLKETNDPNPLVRARAQQWFKNVEALQNPQRRTDLLGLVYAHYRGLADAARNAAVGGGTTTLTPALRDSFRKIASEACRAADALAERFLQDFLKETKITEGEALIRPAAVEALAASSGLGQVKLSWTLPAHNCDEVEIIRQAEGARKPETVYRGRASSFSDTSVSGGTAYTYRAISYSQGIRMNDTPPAVQAVCLAEVSEAKAAWDSGSILLTWTPPARAASVAVFRSASGSARVRIGANGPEPADSATRLLRRGSFSTFTDRDVAEGAAYDYAIVCEFGPAVASEGVHVRVVIPKPPAAAASLTAAYQCVGAGNEVTLKWPGLGAGVAVQYVVVRREGSEAAGRPLDGAIIETTGQTGFTDTAVSPGRRYTYTVFTKAGDLYSRTGASAPPVDILAEVVDLTAKTGDSTVELKWTPPSGVERVVVRRSLEPPRDSRDGAQVKITGPGGAKDEGLRNDRRCHYLVSCVYRPDGSTEVFSPGVRIAAMPTALPDAVTGFRVSAAGREIVCEWTPPARGTVVIRRSAKPHGFPPGHRLDATDVEKHGEAVVAPATGRAVDSQPEILLPYYSVFTVSGAHAVTGGEAAAAVVPDVTGLRLCNTKDGVMLRWHWPDCSEVTSVRILRRPDARPEGPDDPKAVAFRWSLREYGDAGEKFIDKVQDVRMRAHYVVYAVANAAGGTQFSRGEDEGCQGDIEWGPRMTLRYRMEPAQGPGGEELRLSWEVEQPFDDFGGFTIVGNQANIPASLHDGVVLFSLPAQRGMPAAGQSAWVSLQPVRSRRWPQFYAKLILNDPAQASNTLVVHPDVSTQFSEKGELLVPALPSTLRKFAAGVPQTVICPYCFGEFPVERMWCTSFSGGDKVRLNYSWLQKALKRPLPVPRDKQGRRLTKKLCPDEHELPYTAGDQSSLVIGVIGGKYAGKSTYIASLIERLQGRVCGDLQAALLPVSAEGQKRFEEEFYKPQFVNKREIGVTVGSPPPLIYELTLDGKVFGEKRNRSVTLALYDTAGENLKDPSEVRRTVQYLKVASGVLFLIDPLQAPVVRDKVPRHVRLPVQDPSALPHNIISNVMKELQDNNVLGDDGRLPIPVAVVLTKCDVLRDAGLIEPNRLWCEETRHITYFDDEIHNDTTGMMSEYIRQWSEDAYNVVRQKFSRFSFFGVSSTGCAADRDTGRYRFISPWRVEDPLLWLLAELGVIRTRTGGIGA